MATYHTYMLRLKVTLTYHTTYLTIPHHASLKHSVCFSSKLTVQPDGTHGLLKVYQIIHTWYDTTFENNNDIPTIYCRVILFTNKFRQKVMCTSHLAHLTHLSSERAPYMEGRLALT